MFGFLAGRLSGTRQVPISLQDIRPNADSSRIRARRPSVSRGSAARAGAALRLATSIGAAIRLTTVGLAEIHTQFAGNTEASGEAVHGGLQHRAALAWRRCPPSRIASTSHLPAKPRDALQAVADAALLLAGQFFGLDAGRCVLLAVLHDKMELYTGDYDPVGPDGQGSGTHAFNQAARDRKEAAELDAMERYLLRLRPGARNPQRRLLTELIGGRTEEARFVRAVDKLQALAFVLAKKDGVMSDAHIRFTLRYSGKAKASFPGLGGHHRELVSRLLKAVAKARNVPLPCIESRFRDLLTS